jgi:hypothetical protein
METLQKFFVPGQLIICKSKMFWGEFETGRSPEVLEISHTFPQILQV